MKKNIFKRLFVSLLTTAFLVACEEGDNVGEITYPGPKLTKSDSPTKISSELIIGEWTLTDFTNQTTSSASQDGAVVAGSASISLKSSNMPKFVFKGGDSKIINISGDITLDVAVKEAGKEMKLEEKINFGDGSENFTWEINTNILTTNLGFLTTIDDTLTYTKSPKAVITELTNNKLVIMNSSEGKNQLGATVVATTTFTFTK